MLYSNGFAGIALNLSNSTNLINASSYSNVYGIYLESSSLNNLYNLNSYSNNYEISSSSWGSSSNNILRYNNSYGEIKFRALNQDVQANLRFGQTIIISNNQVYINTSAMPVLNSSANISFFNNDYNGQYPLRFLKIIKNNVSCNISLGCYNFTSLTSSNVIINVSDFGNGTINLGKLISSSSETNLNNGWNIFSLQMAGNVSGNKTLHLDYGWNLIGLSSEGDINYNNISYINSTGSTFSIGDAAVRGHIQKQFVYYSLDSLGISKYYYSPLDSLILNRGKGYWIYVNEVNGGNISLLNAGGNQIGESYSFDDISFKNSSGTELNFSSASSTSYNWVENNIYSWNSSSGFNALGSSDSLYSWRGYFIKSKSNNITILRQS